MSDSENGTSLSWPRGTVCIESKELEKDPSLTICVFGHCRHVTSSNDTQKRGMYEIGRVHVQNVYRCGSGRMFSLRGKDEDEEVGVLVVTDWDVEDNSANTHEHLHPYVGGSLQLSRVICSVGHIAKKRIMRQEKCEEVKSGMFKRFKSFFESVKEDASKIVKCDNCGGIVQEGEIARHCWPCKWYVFLFFLFGY